MKQTGEWTARFLKALTKAGGVVRYACTAAKVSKTAVYKRRDEDDEFRAAMVAAQDDGADELEKIARERAKRCSDVLLIFLLKAARPEKYRENIRHEHGGTIGLEIVEEITDADLGPATTAPPHRAKDGAPPPDAEGIS